MSPAAPAPAYSSGSPEPVALPKLTHTQIAPEPTGDGVSTKTSRLLAIYFDMTSMQILDQLHALDAAQRLSASR